MFRELGEGVNRAAARALNDTITTVRAVGAREIKKNHRALRIGDIKRSMKLGRATRNLLSARTTTSGKAQPLSRFRPRLFKVGTKATIGNERVLLGKAGRRVFIIPRYGNEYFIRKSDSGRRVRRFRGPSLPGVFRAQLDRFRAIARDRWAVTFPNRMRFEIEKAQRKARGGG